MGRRPSLAAAFLIIIALIVVATIIVPTPMGFARYVLPKELALHLLAFGLLVCVAVRPRGVDLERADWWLLGFCALGVVSLLAATNLPMATRAAALPISGAVVFIVARSIGRTSLGDVLILTVVFSAILVAVVALLEAMAVLPSISMPGRRPGGVFGNRNFMAHHLVLSLPACFIAAARGGRARLGLAVVASLVLVWAIGVSRSRGAWLGLASVTVGFAGFAIVARAARRRIGVVLVGAALGMVCAIAIPTHLEFKSGAGATASRLLDYRSGTGRGRVIQYRNSAELAIGNPILGVGPGNWSVRYPEVADVRDPSHRPRAATPVNRLPNSDWLGVASERGLLALALAVLFGLALVGSRLRRVVRNRCVKAAAGLAVLSSAAVMGAFDAVLLRPGPVLLVAVVVGVTSGSRVGASIRPAAVIGFILCLFAAGGGAVQSGAAIVGNTIARDSSQLERAIQYRPDSYVFRARLAERFRRDGNCKAAIRFAHEALELFPSYARAERTLFRCDVPPR